MGTLLSRFAGLFRKKDPRKPIHGCGPKLKNLCTKNFRGIIGFFVPLFLLSWQGERFKFNITTRCIWLWMFWTLLWHPVNVPVCGIIPIFIFPLTGVLSTEKVAQCYFNDSIALFIIGGMMHLMMNMSGVDRRLALWFLCSGDACQFSAKRLMFKASTAAFFLSMFSNKLIITSTILQYITPPFINLQGLTAKIKTEPNYDKIRYIICNAVHTSSSIGSIVIIHAAFATVTFRALWYESAPFGSSYPDIFNYLQYTCYAFPVAFLMYILNVCYNMILINCCVGKQMSSSSMDTIRKDLRKHQSALPKTNAYEKLSVFFVLFSLIMYIFRWSSWLNYGWSTFRKEEYAEEIPRIKDATVAALFVVALHILPKGCGFIKVLMANTMSQLPPSKTESGLLFWRFADRNTNYAYIFLIGAGIALYKAAVSSGLGTQISTDLGKVFTSRNFNGSLFLVCLFAMFLANIMTGVGACIMFLPFVLCMSFPPGAPNPWPAKVYLGALGVGIGSSFGFMFPYLYTPTYYSRYTGKVPQKYMVTYTIGSLIICLILLWLSLVYWAPIIFDPDGNGITVMSLVAPIITPNTTAAMATKGAAGATTAKHA